MTRQTNIQQNFGLLTWWTIHQGNYDVTQLSQVAQDTHAPARIRDLLSGMNEKTAWLKATQLGAKGVVSVTHDSSLQAKYLTKNLRDETRAIVREVRDLDNKRVESVQVATIGRDNLWITAEVEQSVLTNGYFAEIEQLLYDMQTEMDAKIHHIDDQKVRYAVLQWLDSIHRVCVRGTGGVYFIPVTPKSEQQRTLESIAVREWIKQTGVGSFSVVTLREDSATDLSDFQESAVEEVLAELDKITQSLTQYELNERMNDGSRMYSASTQVANLSSLEKKVKDLNASLGDVIDRVDAQFIMVKKRALKMQQEAAEQVTLDQLRKGKDTDSSQSGKKAGTAADRKRKKVFA